MVAHLQGNIGARCSNKPEAQPVSTSWAGALGYSMLSWWCCSLQLPKHSILQLCNSGIAGSSWRILVPVWLGPLLKTYSSCFAD